MIAIIVALMLHADPTTTVVSHATSERVTFTAEEALAVSFTLAAVREELAKTKAARPLTAYYVAVERVGTSWRVTWAVNDVRVRDGALRFKVDAASGSIERESDASGLLRKP